MSGSLEVLAWNKIREIPSYGAVGGEIGIEKPNESGAGSQLNVIKTPKSGGTQKKS